MFYVNVYRRETCFDRYGKLKYNYYGLLLNCTHCGGRQEDKTGEEIRIHAKKLHGF